MAFPQSMSLPKVVIVADDLTGALDSAVAFAERGLSVITARTPDKLDAALASEADVVAVSTGTRDCSTKTARAVLADVQKALRTHTGILFKKVDSRLKGNVPVEIEALAGLRSGGAVVCPAIPRLGRLVKDGAVVGAGVDAPIQVAPRIGSLLAEIPDALCDADIDHVILDPLDKQFFVGAAGLAEALARHLVPKALKRAGAGSFLPALLAIGSRDPVTLEQMKVLISAGLPVSAIAAPNGIVPDFADDTQGVSLIQMVPGAAEVSAENASQAFAKGVVAHVLGNQPKTLFASGGESANALLEELGVDLLQVHGEVLPGVPWSTARDGYPGLRIVTKSGGFGDQQTLIALCNAFWAQ